MCESGKKISGSTSVFVMQFKEREHYDKDSSCFQCYSVCVAISHGSQPRKVHRTNYTVNYCRYPYFSYEKSKLNRITGA